MMEWNNTDPWLRVGEYAAFLKRDVPVTIEVNSDNSVGQRLSFRAEIHQ